MTRSPVPRHVLLLAATLLLHAACSTGAVPPATASGVDLVVVAPIVRTLDPELPEAQVVAIRGGRIAAVGGRELLATVVGPATRVIELPAGSCLLPGFIDSHAHLLGLGRSLRELDLVGTQSFEEVIARTAERAAREPKGTWIHGRGWDQNRWPGAQFPDHHALSAAVPDHPVLLQRVDGHAALANAAALALAHVDAATPAPAGGEILHDASGAPTGVLVDAAVDLVARVIPPPGPADERDALERALDACRRNGITSFHDAGEEREGVALLREAAAQHRLTARIYLMLAASDPSLVDEWFERGPLVDAEEGFLTIRAVKVYADGALGSRGAALLEPYSDRPDHSGLMQTDGAAIAALARRALDAGFQVCTHAIGDRGNRVVLDAYEQALAGWARAHPGAPRPDHRFRVEHAQLLAPVDVPRFAALGVIASMQTCHATSDGPWVPARLGPQRTRDEAYPWRSLLASGATICNGTDAPVESLSPLRNLFAAITREDEEGRMAGGFLPEQRMTPMEALVTLTRAGAFASFEEQQVGMLRTGCRADLVALSLDPLGESVRLEPRLLLRASIRLTIVAGALVYSAG